MSVTSSVDMDKLSEKIETDINDNDNFKKILELEKQKKKQKKEKKLDKINEDKLKPSKVNFKNCLKEFILLFVLFVIIVNENFDNLLFKIPLDLIQNNDLVLLGLKGILISSIFVITKFIVI